MEAFYQNLIFSGGVGRVIQKKKTPTHQANHINNFIFFRPSQVNKKGPDTSKSIQDMFIKKKINKKNHDHRVRNISGSLSISFFLTNGSIELYVQSVHEHLKRRFLAVGAFLLPFLPSGLETGVKVKHVKSFL